MTDKTETTDELAERTVPASPDLHSIVLHALSSARGPLLPLPAHTLRLLTERVTAAVAPLVPYREVWDASLPPGGMVCNVCGEPVESEPCAEHNPAAVAEQLRAENRALRAAQPGNARLYDTAVALECERDQLRARLEEMTRLRDNALRALYRDDVDTGIDLEETIAAPFYGPGWDWDEQDLQRVVREAADAIRPAFGKLTQERDQARADLAKYVGHEPTIADEMAYLTRCLDTVHDLCDLAKQRDRATVTVAELELSLNCEWQSPTPRPALPWAHAMEASDLHLFLDDLVSAALNRWRTDVDGPVPDRETLAAIEKACTDWRTPGQGLRSDEPGTKSGEDR